MWNDCVHKLAGDAPHVPLSTPQGQTDHNINGDTLQQPSPDHQTPSLYNPKSPETPYKSIPSADQTNMGLGSHLSSPQQITSH
jgi:hypothetical protein